MESGDFPTLVSCKPLKPDFDNLRKISITSEEFTVGRGLQNAAVIPFLSISRNHCTFNKINDEWFIKDNSTFGIEINGYKLGKDSTRKLAHEDIIALEPTAEFVYKLIIPSDYEYEVPKKRIKIEKHEDTEENNIINNVKIKFEASQNYEIKHITDKILNAKHMQTTSKILKEQLQLDMNRKIQQLETDFALQIENLKGEKNQVEQQKALLIEERDAQLSLVKEEMEGKIAELMSQIKKHNETESELVTENTLLKEKLLKEREEFLSELSRENSSKQDMLEKLEAKIREQKEVQLQEKQALEEMLRKETEQLRVAKEKELKELEEQKRQRELELQQELDKIKKNLQEQVEQTEQQRLEAERQLSDQMEQMKKLSDVEKVKMKQLMHDREDMQKLLQEAQKSAENSLQELRTRVAERETELAALAAERIQQQAEQSSEVIQTLQEQLEKVKNQLQTVETEKNTLLANVCQSDTLGEGSSKQTALTEVGELMESELQCSICAELFVESTTLNCSHTFCKYCITMWKKKKKDCPICRTPIITECKSLVLDSFIEKMAQNLTQEMKIKRQEMLVARQELESELARQTNARTHRRSHSFDDSDISDDEFLEEEEEDYENYDDYGSWPFGRRRYYASDTDSGSDDDTNDSDSSSAAAAVAARVVGAGDSSTAGGSAAASIPNTEDGANGGGGTGRRRGRVPGQPGAYYGGYGRCFSCGARGHWAPGCPYR